MKKIIYLFIALLFYTCKQPFANLTTNDQKSEKIKTLFKKVGEENIEYLKEIFSDKMQLVDPLGNTLDKTRFIAGIENLYDLFEDISVKNMDGDALGAEVETASYKNGIIWTFIWNTFSATGKYTNQKVSFPFHIAYQWEGDKIIKEVQFFDLSVIEKEMNAKSAKNNTSTKVVANIDMEVNPGYTVNNIKVFLEKLSQFIRDKEPNTYDYSYFVSKDGKRITLIEKFRTSEDFIFHVENFENGPNIEPFMKMFAFKSFVIAGNTSEALRERIKGYPVDYRGNIGGWID